MIIEPQNIEELMDKIGTQPLVIYGMGYVGRLIAEWCDKTQISYVYADQLAEEKRKDTDKQVLFPEQLKQNYSSAIVVIASINYFVEIQESLKKMGFEENQIISCMRFWPKKISWEELEDTANWENVKQRAKLFAKWIAPTVKTVADYGHEKNFLKEFLPDGMQYKAPNYIRIQEDALVADFEQEGAVVFTDVAFGMAILMSFLNVETVIEHLCKQTKSEIIISYVPFEKLSDVSLRRCVNYHNDYTENELIEAFLCRGFVLKRKETDPFDEVNIVYLFEKE